MKTTYAITQAHSGNSQQEIEKAKRFFSEQKQQGMIFGQISPVINIQFSDINNTITARFVNQLGEEICNPCVIQ